MVSESRREVRSRWGGSARLPLVLSGLLSVVGAGLIALVVIGTGLEDPRITMAEPGVEEGAQPEAQERASVAPLIDHGRPSATEPSETAAAHPDGTAADPAPEHTADHNSATESAESAHESVEIAPARLPQAVPPKVEAAEVVAPQKASPNDPPLVAAVPTPPPPAPAAGTGILPPAPDPGLVEQTSIGPLPRIGDDGRQPWQVYARPFDNRDTRPRIALVMSGLGLSGAATQAAIQGLPGGVTLAFQPFADDLQQWIQLARAAGHEVLLNLPMEPVDFPASDPGPRALFVAYAPEENVEHLEWALSRVSGYVGLLNHMGSRFTTSREAMLPIMRTLEHRGLSFVDARVSARSVATILATEQSVPRAINDRFLDAREVSRTTVDARLAELESIAEEVGVSVGIGQAFPVTIERIREWAATLNGKGIVLAPISAVLDRQADR